jgi:hypothetical protein
MLDDPVGQKLPARQSLQYGWAFVSHVALHPDATAEASDVHTTLMMTVGDTIRYGVDPDAPPPARIPLSSARSVSEAQDASVQL